MPNLLSFVTSLANGKHAKAVTLHAPPPNPEQDLDSAVGLERRGGCAGLLMGLSWPA